MGLTAADDKILINGAVLTVAGDKMNMKNGVVLNVDGDQHGQVATDKQRSANVSW